MNDLVEKIHQLLKDAEQTVSVAESITGGHIQAMLTSVSGASDVFVGGITAYRRSIKVNLLSVDDALARNTDCVDEEIAIQMARGSLDRFSSDYAVATCGYAETDEDTPFAFIAIAEHPGTILFSGRIELSGNRIEAQEQTTRMALDKFYDLLSKETR